MYVFLNREILFLEMRKVFYPVFIVLIIVTIWSGIDVTVLADENAIYLNDILDSYIVSDEPGMVIYVSEGENTLSAIGGLSDLVKKTPVHMSDRFRIGSATKPFVATIVLQLTEEGLVDLDAPLSLYLSADIASHIANTDSATVRQTMQMKSGIPDYMTDAFDDAVEQDPIHPWTAAEVVTFSYNIPADNLPGSEFVYCNNNYVLLQLLIEQVTGNSLAEELETRIFDPTGMNSCYLEDPAHIGDGIIRGYASDNDRFVDVTMENDGLGLGDGGIIGTAEDIAKFVPALLSNHYFSNDMLSQMLTTVPDDEDETYGLGISVIQTPYGELIGHDGASGGFQSSMYYLPDTNMSLVILTNNFDSDVVNDVREEVTRLMTDTVNEETEED